MLRVLTDQLTCQWQQGCELSDRTNSPHRNCLVSTQWKPESTTHGGCLQITDSRLAFWKLHFIHRVNSPGTTRCNNPPPPQLVMMGLKTIYHQPFGDMLPPLQCDGHDIHVKVGLLHDPPHETHLFWDNLTVHVQACNAERETETKKKQLEKSSTVFPENSDSIQYFPATQVNFTRRQVLLHKAVW